MTARIDDAIRRVDEDLRALRGEMWREMQRMQRAMREMQRETVNALAATVAARDPYMHGHATRVAALFTSASRREINSCVVSSPSSPRIV